MLPNDYTVIAYGINNIDNPNRDLYDVNRKSFRRRNYSYIKRRRN